MWTLLASRGKGSADPERTFKVVSLAILMLVAGTPAISGAGPVDPLEVDRAEVIDQVSPFASPAGEQVIGYKRGPSGQTPLGAISRIGGNPFGPFQELTRTSNSERLSIAFAPNGDAYATWGIATTGAAAQQTIRRAGQPFEVLSDNTSCGRFVVADTADDGRLAVACSFRQPSPPNDNFRFSATPEISRIVSSTNVTGFFVDPFILPKIDWGSDGTVAAAARHSLNTVSPEPFPVPAAITARVQAPTFTETLTVDATPDRNAMSLDDILVLPDGTVLVTGSKNGESMVWTRDPGSGNPFFPASHSGVVATQPRVDSNGVTHVLLDDDGGLRAYFVVLRSVGGVYGSDIPVPLTSPAAFISQGGFQVKPDGTEYAVMRDGERIAIARRPAGKLSFEPPVEIAQGVDQGPSTTMTSGGEILVTWVEEVTPGTRRLMVGGWDEKPPAVRAVRVPSRGLVGSELTFSAEASDPMGLRSVRWNFGDGRSAQGQTVRHQYNKFGRFQVRVTATDRAGNRTSRSKTIDVQRGRPNPVALRLNVPARISFQDLIRRGLRVIARGDRPFSVSAGIGTSPRRAARNPIARRTINAKRARQVVLLKPSRRALGNPRDFRLHLSLEATARDGGRSTVNRVIRVTRR
jgi:hypothetical protein